MTSSTNSNDINMLRAQFHAIDRDGSGTIPTKQLREILHKKRNLNLSEKAIEEIISKLDSKGEGKINYSDFMAATMDFDAEKNQKDIELKIQSIFRQFDTDNSGSISRENIMVTKNGTVRLIDFGLATVNSAALRTRTGTPCYMAPEVLEGRYGPQVDMWSLGVMLYQLISGFLPFEAPN